MESNFNLEYFQNQRRENGIINELVNLSKEENLEVFKQGILRFYRNEAWRLLLDDVDHGRNMLHLVCLNNTNLNIIKFLVEERNFDPELKFANGSISLHIACRNNQNLEVIKYLIESGCNLEVKDNDGSTPLHCACYGSQNLEVIKYLIESDCDLEVKDNDGSTPLHIACGNNQNLEVIKYLIESGCDLEARGNFGSTPLHIACGNNQNLEVIKYLIEKGCDLKAKSNDGSTSLHFACYGNPNLEVIKYLIEKGCDLKAKSNDGSTLLHCACSGDHDLEFIQYLIEKGCDLNAKDNDGLTPLHCACYVSPNLEFIQYLIEKGCDLNAKNENGDSPLFLTLNQFDKAKGLNKFLHCITNLAKYIDFDARDSSNHNLLEFLLLKLKNFDDIRSQNIQQEIIFILRMKNLDASEIVLKELSSQDRNDKEAIMKLLFAKRSDLLLWPNKENKTCFRGHLLPERDKKSLETYLLCLKTKGQKMPKFLFQQSIAPHAISDKENRKEVKKTFICAIL